MKTIFPDEIPEEMEDLREGTDSIEDSLKPILETDEKLRKLSESTSSTLGKLTASSSMLSAFQGYCMNSIFRGFGELAISNAIPKYSFTNPVLWPISSKGAECVWRLIPSRLMRDWKKGYIKVSKNKSKANPNEFSVQYLPEGVIQKVECGELEVVGKEPNAPTLVFGKNKTVGSEIPTIWTEKEFYTTKGTSGVKDILGDKRFSYPKPLELIAEVLRAVSKKDSIVLDFFAGSGTTGHAVIELNAEQHSNRHFILCTNNESSICDKVTYPRIKTVITGKREDGSEYAMGLPANVKYYHTDFISKDAEYLSNELLGHIREMIQLEHGVKIDGSQYLMVMSDEEADELQSHWSEYEGVKAIYASKDVLFTTEQNALFEGVEIHTIPDY